MGNETTDLVVLNSETGFPVTTSLKIAEKFEKQHKHVIEAIKNLEIPEDFRQPNFRLTERETQMPGNGAIRKDPMYEITRDGFTFLAMGFTGKKAAEWKIKYIEAFNRMERHIKATPQDAVMIPRADYERILTAMEKSIAIYEARLEARITELEKNSISAEAAQRIESKLDTLLAKRGKAKKQQQQPLYESEAKLSEESLIEFIKAWYAEKGTSRVGVGDLFPLVLEKNFDLPIFGSKTERGQRVCLGNLIKKLQGKPFHIDKAEVAVKNSGKIHRSAQYVLNLLRTLEECTNEDGEIVCPCVNAPAAGRC